MWDLKNNANKCIYAKQKQTHGYSKQTSAYQMGEGRGGGKLSGMRLRRCKLLYKNESSKGILYITEGITACNNLMEYNL